MAKNSMDLLELLRKRGMDGDVDFVEGATELGQPGLRRKLSLRPSHRRNGFSVN